MISKKLRDCYTMFLEYALFINFHLLMLCTKCSNNVTFVIVNDCPSTEQGWLGRAYLARCDKSLYHHCLLSTTGRFVEFCGERHYFPGNVCPVVTFEDGSISLMRMPCAGRVGCPLEIYPLDKLYQCPFPETPHEITENETLFTVVTLNHDTGHASQQYFTTDYQSTGSTYGLTNSSEGSVPSPLDDLVTQILITAGGIVLLLIILTIVLLIYINMTKPETDTEVQDIPLGVQMNSIYDEVNDMESQISP